MGSVITLAQQKGGAGKTTVLAHLAAAWAEAGRSVAVIDLDPQRSLTRWVGIRADPAIELVDSRDYRAAGDIKQAKKSHDIVLVDCPGAASSLLENAMRESDLVLQVAANPLIANMGSSATASSRLTLAQAFNSLGTTIFPPMSMTGTPC